MKQIGYKVTRKHLESLIKQKNIKKSHLDIMLGLTIGTTNSYLTCHRELSTDMAIRYFAYQGELVDIVEVTPNAIICG